MGASRPNTSFHPPPPETIKYQTLSGEVSIPVIDGTLNFPDFETYLNVEDAVSSTETSFVSESDLDALEMHTSFESLRKMLNDLTDEYLHGDLPVDDMIDVVEKNSMWIYWRDGAPTFTLADRTLRTLLDVNGTIVIGEQRVIYRPDRAIYVPVALEVNFNRLPTQTDSTAKIFVFKEWYSESISEEAAKADCAAPTNFRSGTGPELNRRRVTTLAGIRTNRSLVTINGFPDSWRFSYRVFGEHKSWNRASFGNYWRQGSTSTTRLQFTQAVGVRSQLEGTAGGGQGWTQTNVRTINVSWNPYGNGAFFVASFFEANIVQAIDNFVLRYVTSAAKDHQNPGSFTFGCCPWDCSDRSYTNFD